MVGQQARGAKSDSACPYDALSHRLFRNNNHLPIYCHVFPHPL